MSKLNGYIKYLNKEKGYGYIKSNIAGYPDISFDINGLDLNLNETVSFDLNEIGGGKCYASDVKKVTRNPMLFSTEDKQKWCEMGLKDELKFLENMASLMGRKLDLHPEKKKGNKYHIDLIDLETGRNADLKHQETPFFTAARQNPSLSPTYTVTFNRKDYENYKNNYPDADIYWWVNWKQLEWNNIKVDKIDGVWVCKFCDMADLIEKGEVVLHGYQNRVNDDVNAKDSYLFDLRNPIFTRLL